jgi:FKBP-type peptidyl-prolyl cis-trans isomerase FklB
MTAGLQEKTMRAMILAAISAAFLSVLFSEGAMAGDLSAAANQTFLAANATKQGVVTRPSGLQYRVIKAGHGKTPKASDMVQVTYKGWLIDNTVFDGTKPGDTAEFPANRLISGWVEALSLMKEGDDWELVIPANLAYGERGAGNGLIPANQVLVFDMTLIKVK